MPRVRKSSTVDSVPEVLIPRQPLCPHNMNCDNLIKAILDDVKTLINERKTLLRRLNDFLKDDSQPQVGPSKLKFDYVHLEYPGVQCAKVRRDYLEGVEKEEKNLGMQTLTPGHNIQRYLGRDSHLTGSYNSLLNEDFDSSSTHSGEAIIVRLNRASSHSMNDLCDVTNRDEDSSRGDTGYSGSGIYQDDDNSLSSAAHGSPTAGSDTQSLYSTSSRGTDPRSSALDVSGLGFPVNVQHWESKGRRGALEDKTVLLGVTIFNTHSGKGIWFLSRFGYLRQDDPQDIGKWLYTCCIDHTRRPPVNTAQVGQYIGGASEFNQRVLLCFVRYFKSLFENKQPDEALRIFLCTFQLPVETQQIDRILKCLGEVYIEAIDIPLVISSLSGDRTRSLPEGERRERAADVAYVLSYAILLLNTDQHNSKVKSSMSVQQFIANTKGSKEMQHLPDKFLEDIYGRIQGGGFTLLKDDGVERLFKRIAGLPKETGGLVEPSARRFLAMFSVKYLRSGMNKLHKAEDCYLLLFTDVLLVVSSKESAKKLQALCTPSPRSSEQENHEFESVEAALTEFSFKYLLDLPLLKLELSDTPTAAKRRSKDSELFAVCLRSSFVDRGRKEFTFCSTDARTLDALARELTLASHNCAVLEKVQNEEGWTVLQYNQDHYRALALDAKSRKHSSPATLGATLSFSTASLSPNIGGRNQGASGSFQKESDFKSLLDSSGSKKKLSAASFSGFSGKPRPQLKELKEAFPSNF